MHSRPAVRFQPATLAEALYRLNEPTEAPVRLDTGRIAEMSGIQQTGGRLAIGLNTTPGDLAYSSLVRAEATCLAEAARFSQARGAEALVAEMTPLSGLALALVALAAEIEVACLRPGQAVSRAWQPLIAFLENPPASRTLAVAVRLDVRRRIRGSAYVAAPAVRGAAASLQAAAASLILDKVDGVVVSAAIALLPKEGPLFAVEPAAALLQGKAINPDGIAAAAQQAQVSAQTRLGAGFTSTAFPVHVAAHLVRKALDRAAARCLSLMETGA